MTTLAASSTSPVTVEIAANAGTSPNTVAAGGVAFDALTGGPATVLATAPGFNAAFPQASVAVTVSQRVSAGDQLCVLEAIKLEQSIRAPVPGVVRAVHVQPGQSVTAGEAMLELG